ncbi:N-acetylmuramoyl-L-alanine amidase [Ruminococcus sp. HUN007]|jgi:N-acetylmuramoyl-L-alanine amidase|uniref:N-acetylmuramoyl-L-alanine amidase family protein n=1 Tax=Ruminococcus sp. HUN007 TaxID=1514668 RepID=UPI0006786DEC|nr:N-acetylmuramoyl-L-alanine amidase [Ruminococcus sp. HUN007]
MAGSSSGKKRVVRRIHKGRVCGCLTVFVLIFILISTLINGCTKKHNLQKQKKGSETSISSTVSDTGSSSQNEQVHKDEYIICVDPGHGGDDIGSSNGDRLEKVDNLRYATVVYEELMNREGLKPIITRQSNDTFMSNRERADFANEAKADLYIALHRNMSEDHTANGLEIWVQQQATVVDDVLGFKLKQELTKVGIQYDRGVQHGYTNDKQNNFQIIEWTDMPACIIELGFISNDEDNRLFDAHYKDYAKAIADAVESLCREGYLDKVKQPQ